MEEPCEEEPYKPESTSVRAVSYLKKAASIGIQFTVVSETATAGDESQSTVVDWSQGL